MLCVGSVYVYKKGITRKPWAAGELEIPTDMIVEGFLPSANALADRPGIRSASALAEGVCARDLGPPTKRREDVPCWAFPQTTFPARSLASHAHDKRPSSHNRPPHKRRIISRTQHDRVRAAIMMTRTRHLHSGPCWALWGLVAPCALLSLQGGGGFRA